MKNNSKEQKSRGASKDLYPKKLLPRQTSELTAGNLEGSCKPPNEVQGAWFWKKIGNSCLPNYEVIFY